MTTDQAYYVLMDYIFPDFYEWIFISLFLLVFIFGIVGNILVFYAVWSNVQLRNATNFFLVNLSIADFMVLLICLPPTVIHDVAQTWFLGEILCKLISYLQVSISLFSNLMVTSNPYGFILTAVEKQVILKPTFNLLIKIDNFPQEVQFNWLHAVDNCCKI
jgi:hypothetical protein